MGFLIRILVAASAPLCGTPAATAVGAAARLFGTGFPLGTMMINVLGSFVMGLFFMR